MEITSLGVHPAHWRNGLGQELVRPCVEFADTEKVPLVVSCSPMGARVFNKFGFVEKELVKVEGHDHHDGITVSFQQRRVSTLHSEGDEVYPGL